MFLLAEVEVFLNEIILINSYLLLLIGNIII